MSPSAISKYQNLLSLQFHSEMLKILSNEEFRELTIRDFIGIRPGLHYSKVLREYPLDPYEISSTKKTAISHTNKLSKQLLSKGLQVETILLSPYSEHVFHYWMDNLLPILYNDELKKFKYLNTGNQDYRHGYGLGNLEVDPIEKSSRVNWFTLAPLS